MSQFSKTYPNVRSEVFRGGEMLRMSMAPAKKLRAFLAIVAVCAVFAATGCTNMFVSTTNGGAIASFVSGGLPNTPTTLTVSMDGGQLRHIKAIKAVGVPTTAVVAIHGVAMKADDFLTNFYGLVSRNPGVAVFAPSGLNPRGIPGDESFNAGTTRNAYGQITAFCCAEDAKQNVDDVGFVVRLISTLRAAGYKEVDVIGFSNGAMLAALVACTHNVADHSGLAAGTLEVPTCPLRGYIKPMLALNGSLDGAIPLSGTTPYPFVGGYVGLLNPLSVLLNAAGPGIQHRIEPGLGHTFSLTEECEMWQFFGHSTC